MWSPHGDLMFGKLWSFSSGFHAPLSGSREGGATVDLPETVVGALRPCFHLLPFGHFQKPFLLPTRSSWIL